MLVTPEEVLEKIKAGFSADIDCKYIQVNERRTAMIVSFYDGTEVLVRTEIW